MMPISFVLLKEILKAPGLTCDTIGGLEGGRLADLWFLVFG